ncbi:unnamed protein product [Caenorhabditis sp. 36 PRJEB53466]|nr:unnamed protein product [Caenorhabditis sp. 36 PRJEB53466]
MTSNERNQKKHLSHLLRRLREPKKTIGDVYVTLGRRSPYYMLSLTLNALLFAVFDHLNGRTQYLIYSDKDFQYTDEYGRVMGSEHPTAIDENGRYKTNNGAIPLPTMTILQNISSVFGCWIAFLVARSSHRLRIIIFSVIIVASFLFSQAFLFSFLDRFAFIISSMFSKAISLLAIQAAFEAGPGKYRIYAVGFAYYLAFCFVFVTIILFKNESPNYAETHFMLIVAGFSTCFALFCPESLLKSISERNIPRVREIFQKFGKGDKRICYEAMVDDVLYKGHVPQNSGDALRHLLKIKPFMKKLAALAVLNAFQTQINSGEAEFINTMLPYSPLESILFSRIAASVAALLTIFFIVKVGRRPLLLFLLALNLLVSLYASLIPIDSFSVCYSRDVPHERWGAHLKFAYISITMIRVSTNITLLLLILEHIPALYRSYAFPLVMLFDALFVGFSDAAPNSESSLSDSPLFLRPMIRYSVLSLILAAFSVDDSDACVISTVEIPCYNTEQLNPAKSDNELVNNFEEKFRLLCEVKAAEKKVQMQKRAEYAEKVRKEMDVYRQTTKRTKMEKREKEKRVRQYMDAFEEKVEKHDAETKKILMDMREMRLNTRAN